MFWINVWRIGVLIVCVLSFLIMVVGFGRHHDDWNKKTRDYWYGRVMWIVAGMVIAIEGLVRGIHDDYGLVFITAAALATLKGNLQRGSWGNPNADR